MKPISLKTIGILALVITGSIFYYATDNTREKGKKEDKIAYNKTKDKEYNPELDSLRQVAMRMATRYKDRDSVDLRVHYIEGCRWIGVINGGCSDRDYHTISNCPKCMDSIASLFVSLTREP